MLAFLRNAGFPCPPFENPADFMLDLIHTERDEEEGELGRDQEAAGDGAEHRGEGHAADTGPGSQCESLTVGSRGLSAPALHEPLTLQVRLPVAPAPTGVAAESQAHVVVEMAAPSTAEQGPSEGGGSLSAAERQRCGDAADARVEECHSGGEEKEQGDPPLRTVRTASSTAQYVERMPREEIVLLLCQHYASSELAAAMLRRPHPFPAPLTALDGGRQRKYPTSWWTQFWGAWRTPGQGAGSSSRRRPLYAQLWPAGASSTSCASPWQLRPRQ